MKFNLCKEREFSPKFIKKGNSFKKRKRSFSRKEETKKISKVLHVGKHKLLFKFPFRYFLLLWFKDETKYIS